MKNLLQSRGKYLLRLVPILIITSLFYSCKVLMPYSGPNYGFYPGEVVLKSGEKVKGTIGCPTPLADKVLISDPSGKETIRQPFLSGEVAYIELYNSASPNKKQRFEYLPLSENPKNPKNRWVAVVAKGEYLNAYVDAQAYDITENGNLTLLGTTQIIQHGAPGAQTTIQPSFPIYFMKKGDKKLTFTALKGGISFESSSFRSGVSRSLADDPHLCEYMRTEKWGFNNLAEIVKLYNPHRGNSPLIINGKEYTATKPPLLTPDLNNELIYSAEVGVPLTKPY